VKLVHIIQEQGHMSDSLKSVGGL